MCETIDLIVFHPKIAISTPKTIATAAAKVPSGTIGAKIPKYPPKEVAASVTPLENPVESGKDPMMPEMRV